MKLNLLLSQLHEVFTMTNIDSIKMKFSCIKGKNKMAKLLWAETFCWKNKRGETTPTLWIDTQEPVMTCQEIQWLRIWRYTDSKKRENSYKGKRACYGLWHVLDMPEITQEVFQLYLFIGCILLPQTIDGHEFICYLEKLTQRDYVP